MKKKAKGVPLQEITNGHKQKVSLSPPTTDITFALPLPSDPREPYSQ